jgi:hypothetical protein
MPQGRKKMAIQYTQAEFEALTAEQMLEAINAGASIAEQEQVKQTLINEIEANNLTLEELKAKADAEAGGDEREILRQQHIQEIANAETADQLDRRFADKSPEEIKAELARRTAIGEIEGTGHEWLTADELRQRQQKPVKAEPVAQGGSVDPEQRLRDAAFVADEIEKSNGAAIDAAVDRKLKAIQAQAAKEQAEIDKSLKAQQEFVDAHPDFVATPKSGNGDTIIKFIRDELKHQSLTRENLEIAYQTLKARNALYLLSPEQVEAKNKLQEVIETGKVRPTRRASSVSSQSDGGFYSHSAKKEYSVAELEAMPMEKLRELGVQDGWIDPDAQMHEGVRQHRPTILSQF